jgi:hypothetical protein
MGVFEASADFEFEINSLDRGSCLSSWNQPFGGSNPGTPASESGFWIQTEKFPKYSAFTGLFGGRLSAKPRSRNLMLG